MEYLKLPIKVLVDATLEYRFVGPSESAPTPAEGYVIDPDPIELDFPGLIGKFWVEYRITRT